jgi:hypothetical protein
MEQRQKKSWQKPELIVLVRSKPQEAVLTGCKGTLDFRTRGCVRGQSCTPALASAGS